MTRWHHRRHGEWGYRDVPRLLFIEEKLALGGNDLPTDIKVHAFSSGTSHIWVADKLSGRSRTYSAELMPLDVRDRTYPNDEQALPDSTGGGHDGGLDQALAKRAGELWDLRASDFLRKRHRGLVRLYAEALRAAISTSASASAGADLRPRQKAGSAIASHAP